MIKGIQEAVSIPVMAKVRIGHVAEARILQAIEIDYIDESEVLSPADDVYHIDKNQFDVPFVCGAKNLGEALRRIAEGASMIRTKGEPGTGDVIQAVRHMRTMNKQIRELVSLRDDEVYEAAKQLAVPYDLAKYVHDNGRLPVVNFAAGGVATPADAALMMELGAEGGQACRCHRAGHRQLAGRRPARPPFREPRRGHGRHQRRRNRNHHGRPRRVIALYFRALCAACGCRHVCSTRRAQPVSHDSRWFG